MEIIKATKGLRSLKSGGFPKGTAAYYACLKWIINTGYQEEIFEDDYEEALDLAAAALMLSFDGDTSLLEQIVSLMFKRHRYGRYIHDLVWSLFQVHDPLVLKLIAKYLSSPDARDRNLAKELLNLEEEVSADNNAFDDKAYVEWIEENKPYLYFTGETFQYSSKPSFFSLDLGRKYLQKTSDSYPSNERELVRMDEFSKLNEKQKRLLAEHSHKVAKKDVTEWQQWISSPLSVQIKYAAAEGEVEP